MSESSKDIIRNVSQKPGLQIWTINVSSVKRIKACDLLVTGAYVNVLFVMQNMEMVPVPAQAYGNFFEGDCYIVLSVSAFTTDFPRGCIETLMKTSDLRMPHVFTCS